MSVRTGDTTEDATCKREWGARNAPSAERGVSDEATREWQLIEQTTPKWHLHSVSLPLSFASTPNSPLFLPSSFKLTKVLLLPTAAPTNDASLTPHPPSNVPSPSAS